MPRSWDVVVVGGRVAGASTALLLARAGARVLVVDRARRGSDTLSTHALMRGGVLLLNRWGLLERVVANLVSNAVRVSSGTPVRVLAHVLPDSVEIMVVDRGPGVAPQLRVRMFDPFQRLDDTSPGGLGLGLAVARGLTQALGGQLTAEDTPGGGLTMVLSIPRARS